ncbi:hypothetical protein Enr10x_41050 [Gimesia panareensis]|uniref:Uncharacterized protein n=1 Tax=Gimesia panareensis TaxID=2527978 RepID=A0A517QAV5_9PLAN|nr:hypothetical protein Enr10x_41050 [Gimesia panareensis]
MTMIGRKAGQEFPEKKCQTLDAEGVGDVTIGLGFCLERFQDQPPWEIPVN